MPLDQQQQDAIRKYFETRKFPVEINTCVVGATGAGVKDILNRALRGFFEPNYFDPLGDDTDRGLLCVQDKQVIVNYASFSVFFSEQYRAMFDYYVRAYKDGFILVYDVSSRKSFARLETVLEKVYSILEINSSRDEPQDAPAAQRRPMLDRFRERLFRKRHPPPPPSPPPPLKTPPILVIANKIDLPRASWEVSPEEAQQFSKRIGASFYQMSAKTGEGCNQEVLTELASQIIYKNAYESMKAVEGLGRA